MRVQKFAPMTKNFATFDCDAHVSEPPWLWERAKDKLSRRELRALEDTMWFDSESGQLIVNGKAGMGATSAQRMGGTAGALNLLSVAGPGLKHDIQRTLNVRNLDRKTALTKEQAAYLDHRGSYEPKPRLRDMDIQGIDQVMIIPSDIDTYPWLQNDIGAKAMCKAYNEWAYEYCQENPERLYFAALLPLQNPKFAVQELYRVADKGCRVGLVRPIDAMGNYPIQPKYEPVWRAMEETGVIYGMHPFPALGSLKPGGYTEQHSGSELIELSMVTSRLPQLFLTNVQNFQAEAALWVTMVLMSGFFERFPKIDLAQLSTRRVRQGPSAVSQRP
jgi:predicted TIM-barrel fold metal-dependent hydrolase